MTLMTACTDREFLLNAAADAIARGEHDAARAQLDRLLRNGRDRHDDRIDALVIRDPMVLSLDDDLLRAADIMVLRQIRRLTVVADRRVVGSVSRADLCEVLFGR